MKITLGQLRKLLSENAISRLLTEEDDSTAHEVGASGDSLDAQVDRYLGEFESSSKKVEGETKPDVDQMESLDWRDLVKGRLVEAGEGDKDEEDPSDAAPGAESMTDDEPDKLGLDSIDVESFANDVARLIQNYDSLLEVRSTLLRRAKKFLEKTYDEEVTHAFLSTMRDDHSLEAGSSPDEISMDRFKAPAADRANGSAAPGGGPAA